MGSQLEGRVSGGIDRWLDGGIMSGWLDVGMGGWFDRGMAGGIDEGMGESLDEWKDERMNARFVAGMFFRI